MLRKVEASTCIRAPRKLVYAVLTAYERYSDWMPDITDSRVFASEGGVSIVELISPPLGAGKLILEFVEDPDSWLFFNQVDRLREDGLAGRWDIEEAESGDRVIVKGSLSSRDGLLMFGVSRRLRAVLERMLEGLALQCSMLAAAGITGIAGERRKILEITRKDGHLEVQLDGRHFALESTQAGETR